MTGGTVKGRRIVVTGASRGIGAAVVRALAASGARLVLVARDAARLEALRVSLPGGPHQALPLDVADEESWHLAGETLHRDVVDGLVTAAGILGPVGPVGSWGPEGFRRTIEVNLVGTLLAILTLVEPLRASRGAVVAFSGGGAAGPLPNFDAYAASKAALVRLVENLAVELGPDGVRLNCVAPGFVATDMHRETIAAGPELAGAQYYERTKEAVEAGGDPPTLAADLTAFLLSGDAEGITGRLISARWDPWEDPAFRDRLRTDLHLGRLRRIDDQFYGALPAKG